MHVRHADPDGDAGACAAIYAPYVADTAISFEAEPPSAADMTRRIERYSRTHPWLVAEDEREVIGYACPHRERAAYRWAADVSVYVASAHHRKGVGRTLYHDLLAGLEAQGFYVACAGVTLPNEGSVGLHEALGFRAVGVYRRVGFKLGKWWDVGWWQRELRPAGSESPAQAT
jgi:phosphinothricin acetyltransferase